MSVWKLFVTDRRALNLRATASPLIRNWLLFGSGGSDVRCPQWGKSKRSAVGRTNAIGPQRTLAKPLDL